MTRQGGKKTKLSLYENCGVFRCLQRKSHVKEIEVEGLVRKILFRLWDLQSNHAHKYIMAPYNRSLWGAIIWLQQILWHVPSISVIQCCKGYQKLQKRRHSACHCKASSTHKASWESPYFNAHWQSQLVSGLKRCKSFHKVS